MACIREKIKYLKWEICKSIEGDVKLFKIRELADKRGKFSKTIPS